MRKIITFIVVGIFIFYILLAMDHSYVSMNKYISELSPAANIERFKIILLSLCLGIVFDWSNVIKIIRILKKDPLLGSFSLKLVRPKK
ncbi:hypothetical protein AMS62_16850 [Bacillus sp. FJAT-18019]|nr:hypothetical protein AMS62_16850 [Bacillus sp. FJAT-18019]